MRSRFACKSFRNHFLSVCGLLSALIAAERNFIVEIVSVECKHSVPNIIESYGCHLVKYNGRNYGFLYLYLHEPVKKLDVRVYAEAYPSKRQKYTVFDFRLDGCKFLKATHKPKIFQILQLALKRYLNVFPRCPLRAQFNYTSSNFTFIEDSFPTYVPEGRFRIVCDFYRKNKVDASFHITGQISYKKYLKSK